MAAIATVTGTAIRPGVSKNNRLYTSEAIGRMVERAQARIGSSDDMPITMLTHHAAEDDSSRLVGQLTRIWQESDGSAKFEAVLDDTAQARDIRTLATPSAPGRKPTLKGLSIRGAWLGKVRRETGPDGRMVEVGDDVELDGLDWTRKPGVTGAGVESIDPVASQPRESDGSERVPITESAPEATLTEAADSKPYGDVSYADPGYQKDKQKRYPLDTKKRAKAAWSYISQDDNARLYTSAQLKRVKGRIVKALKAFGVTVATQEGWLIEPATALTEALAECWDMASPGGDLYISLTNGPTTVSVSSRLLDPHDLDAVGRAAMAGACDALMALDPDMDADIDVPGAEPEDTDQGMDGDDDIADDEPGSACPCGCGCAVPHPMAVANGCPCGCGCEVCHAGDSNAAETATVIAYAVAGQPFLPEHLDVLKAAGVFEQLKPGEAITAAMVNEAIDAQNAALSPPKTSAPDSAAETPTKEEAPMAETTSPAAEPAGTDGVAALGEKIDKLSDALAGFVTAMMPKAPVEAAPAAPAPVVEAAPVVQETQEQMVARLVAEGVAAALPGAVQETVERQGPPARKGLVQQVTESGGTAGAEPGLNAHGVPNDWPDKPLHQYTADERMKFFGPAVRQHVLQDRFRG